MTDHPQKNTDSVDVNAGWAAAMGLDILKMTAEEVVIEWDVDGRHLQPYGIVHGGVHAGVIETACSLGAAAAAAPRGQIVMGMENHTSFLRAVRGGRLRATARPIHVGQRAQLWEATIVEAGTGAGPAAAASETGSGRASRVVATGRVRLFCAQADKADADKVDKKESDAPPAVPPPQTAV